MGITECMEKTSFREFLVWSSHFEQEWDQPDRTDQYLMQIAREIVVLRTNSNRHKVEDFKLKFSENKQRPMTVEQKTALAKARWAARAGKKHVNDRTRRPPS